MSTRVADMALSCRVRRILAPLRAPEQPEKLRAPERVAGPMPVLYSTERMVQINLHVTAEFEEALEALMRGRRLRSKSEAIRYAVQEAAAPYRAAPARDFSALQGLLRRHAPAKKRARQRPVAELEQEIDDEMERALAARRNTSRKSAR